jgi:cytochrome oxidase Cu insertion factor (SCO1/SenC/PrrC family)
MIRQHVLRLGIAVMLTMLFLVACGNTASTPIPEALSATSTPVPEAPPATSTPELPLASDPLGTGDTAPDFTLEDSNGNMVHLTDKLLDNQLVILVFYHNYT